MLIATGATGGHFYPAISVAEEIRNRRPEAEFLFVGTPVRAEGTRACEASPLLRDACVVHLPAVGMPRRVSVALVPFAFGLLRSFGRSLRWVAGFRPHVAIGFGNFGSFAPLVAAKSLGVPIAIHEANAIPGKANLRLSKLSDAVFVHFPCAARCFPGRRVEVVGMPVRKEFTQPRNRPGALAQLKLSSTKFTLLVVGGSQGARALNLEICNAIGSLQQNADRVQIIHLTGKSDYRWVKRRYESSSLQVHVASFDSRMKLLYDAADLVLARAGASTVAELIHTGRPAILVPFPHATARHQDENARYLENNGGAVVLNQQSESSGQPAIPGLRETLLELLENRDRLEQMAENSRRLFNGSAASKVADALLRIARPEAVVCESRRGHHIGMVSPPTVAAPI